MSKLHLKIVTPEEIIVDEEVDMVTVETTEGEIGILPFHANLMAQIAPGELRIKSGNKITSMATGGGMLQMIENTLSILTDQALEASKIDEKEATEARKRAQDALSKATSDEEIALISSLLERTTAQLKVKRRVRSHM
jgi:F-type H+-transporting ATPase subunit epsilon